MEKTINIMISEEMGKILRVIEKQSIIAKLLLKEKHSIDDIIDDINYISVSSDSKDKISYMNKERLNKAKDAKIDFWSNTLRYQAKPGAFVSKIFKNINTKDVEIFSNLFKSESNRIDFEFKVVKGKDIKKYYHQDRYSNDGGSLGSSCMKYKSSQSLFDIYTKNKEVSMLIMLDNNGFLMGRAILWDINLKIMDRIYTMDDEKMTHYFKTWATENGYLYKTIQNWASTILFENLNTPSKEIRLFFNLPKSERYPYMDTFKFIDDNHRLYNYIPQLSDIKVLAATDGSKLNRDNFRYDSINKEYINSGECNYITYLDIFTNERETNWSTINDMYILKKDSTFRRDLNSYVFVEEMDFRNNHEEIKKVLETLSVVKHEIEPQIHYSFGWNIPTFGDIDSINATLRCSDEQVEID